jgi:hypothetical protein
VDNKLNFKKHTKRLSKKPFMPPKKRKFSSFFDDDDDENEAQEERHSSTTVPTVSSTLRARGKSTKKNLLPTSTAVNADEEQPPPPVRIPYDNRKLRFAKTIDRQDGTSFDYVKTSEAKKYLPLNVAEELDDTSCEELENHLHSKSNHHNHHRNNGSFVSQISSSQTSNYSSSSEGNQLGSDPNEDNDNENLFGDSPRDVGSRSSSRRMIRNEDEDESVASEDILNMPTSNNLNEIEASTNRHSDADTTAAQRPAKFCFGCMWQDPHKINVDANAVSHMMQTMYRFFGQIQTKELAKIVHKQFMHTIYYPFMKQQEEQRIEDQMEDRIPRDIIQLPIWRTKEIYEHLRSHIKDPRFFIYNKLEQLQEESRILSAMSYIYVRDAAGNEHLRPDLAILKTRLEIDKRQIELYNLKYKQMNFYNERLPINIELGGSAMNLHKNLVIRDKPF